MMSRLYRYGSLCTPILVGALLCWSGCFFGDEKQAPSEPTGDTIPPEIVDHYPESGSTGVETNTLIWVEFSETMNEESVTGGLKVTPPFGYLVLWEGNVLELTPTDLLESNTFYTITIAGASEDSNGNELGFDYVIMFITGSGGDLVAPTILSTVPAGGEEGVPPLRPIEVRFSEPMDLASVENAVEIDPWPGVSGIDWQGMTMEIHHGILPQDSLITVTILATASDLAGNPLASPYTWSFRTAFDDLCPYLVSGDPENGATDVLSGLNTVVLLFSEPMNPAFLIPAGDIDARFRQALGDMAHSWDDELTTLSLELQERLLPGCTYWLRLGSGFTDLAGNIIDPEPTRYEFTMSGDLSYFPLQNNYTWYYQWSGGGDIALRIEDYAGGTGTFDLVRERETSPDVWSTEEVWHMFQDTNEMLYLGRDLYEGGVLQTTMTWEDPIPYLEFPLAAHAGTSWDFETPGVPNPASGVDSCHVAGTVEIEELRVDLISGSDLLEGIFVGCYVHRLHGTLECYLDGALVGTENLDERTWFSPGAGPVSVIRNNGSDTLSVYDWEL